MDIFRYTVTSISDTCVYMCTDRYIYIGIFALLDNFYLYYPTFNIRLTIYIQSEKTSLPASVALPEMPPQKNTISSDIQLCDMVAPPGQGRSKLFFTFPT